MKVMSYTASSYASAKKISFGDDCGYVPSTYNRANAMEEMSKNGYIIRGTNTKDAFTRLYSDVDAVLNYTERKPNAISYKAYQENSNVSTNIKYLVRRWDMAKEDFANMMTKFWNTSKNNIQSKDVVTEFLTKTEGMKKPNFFQMFLPKYTDYLTKNSIIDDVVRLFLKNGKHML